MSARAEITELVLQAVADLQAEQGRTAELPGPQTRLFGGGAAFDSMALVSLIADLEVRIEERFGHSVVLADERAMSALRSPFRSVDTLVTHIAQLLDEPARP